VQLSVHIHIDNIMPLDPADIPSPFQHEDGRLDGGEPSLVSKLWDLLIAHSKGLPLDQIAQETGKEKADVEAVLENNDYFLQLDSGYHSLSIFKPLRWGVAGVGKISDDFITAAAFLPGTQLIAAAASSSLPRAQEFAKRHGFKRAHGSYRDLAGDPDVEIVYVGNTHPQHRDTVLTMLEHGKHVLCEKPIGLTADQAEEMADFAKEMGLFLLEGHWDRFFPAAQAARAVVKRGMIGRPRHVESHFGMSAPESIERLYKRELGGGALLDIGVYALSFIQYIYEGEDPTDVQASAFLKDGIDVHGSALLQYPEGKSAAAMWSFQTAAANGAVVFGDAGRIEVPDSHAPAELTIIEVKGSGPGAKEEARTVKFALPPVPKSVDHGLPETKGFHFPTSEGFIFEAAAVHGAVLNKTLQMHGDVPLHQTVALMKLCDTIRAEIGVDYDVALKKFLE
jgi:predicted dehydrogenase